MLGLLHINKIKTSSLIVFRDIIVIICGNWIPIFFPGYSWWWPASNHINICYLLARRNCVLGIEQGPMLNFPIWSILLVQMGKSRLLEHAQVFSLLCPIVSDQSACHNTKYLIHVHKLQTMKILFPDCLLSNKSKVVNHTDLRVLFHHYLINSLDEVT